MRRNAIYLDAVDWYGMCADDPEALAWIQKGRLTMYLELAGEGTIWAWGINAGGPVIYAHEYVVLVKRIITTPPPAAVWKAFETVGVRPWAHAPGYGPRGGTPWAMTPGGDPPESMPRHRPPGYGSAAPP